MSILIKGMEMPKDCPYCPLAHWNFKNEFTGCEVAKKYFSKEELYAEGRPSFCPLVPVPPHGRMIDADALAERFWDGQCYFTESIKRKLQSAPTIIPAEEGE